MNKILLNCEILLGGIIGVSFIFLVIAIEIIILPITLILSISTQQVYSGACALYFLDTLLSWLDDVEKKYDELNKE